MSDIAVGLADRFRLTPFINAYDEMGLSFNFLGWSYSGIDTHRKSRVNVCIMHLAVVDIIVTFIMVPTGICWHIIVIRYNKRCIILYDTLCW